jgi:hypothetical protein
MTPVVISFDNLICLFEPAKADAVLVVDALIFSATAFSLLFF